MRLLLIDNYDSFTYNLAQYFLELEVAVDVVRNDDITIQQITALNPNYIVLSPGPCTPDKAGISLEIINFFAGKIPMLGVCLGHQAIGQYYGGKIMRAREAIHGKTSKIYHNNQGVFKDIPNPFIATRYHSLIVEKNSLPSCLEITAWTQHEDGSMDEIMGLKHKHYLLEGMQFHPESILTTQGHALLKNFLHIT